jgi:hypothetical protein
MANKPQYSFDTNVILTAWNETYRPKNFGGFWNRLEELVAAGRGFICEEVQRELEKKDDSAFGWVKGQADFMVALEEQQVVLTRALTSEYPALAKERLGRMRADGFVIALAQWRGLTVVTAENHRGAEKIPNICSEVGVECISLADMIEKEGWSFS